MMKHKFTLSSLLVSALFMALAPTAVAATTWYVNGVRGSDSNNCKSPLAACKTIGHTVSLAHSGDSIMVAATTYTENNLTIGSSLTIVGAGAQTTIIDGGNTGRVLTISIGARVTLGGLTIRNGGGSCRFCFPSGIFNLGALKINNSTVSGNRYGGIISEGGTGTLTINNSTLSGNKGIGVANVNGGTLTINNSTISGNGAPSEIGGGIFNNGTTTINNSTISGNTANQGGGIANYGGTVTISNSTVSGNTAGSIGGIYGEARLQNSIVANNSGGNCTGGAGSNGYNLSSDNTCNFHGSGDRNNTDPKLGPLQNNGGPTQTMALLAGSPAIDAGNPSGCKDSSGHLLTTDQRGMPRHDPEDTGGCDMGAYERQTD
jgi:hypothetical protein